ncbi:unnamed protein product [Orchesella dallaii]|uniref:JmjC domain-containing protein n=1 Tax=Orchesella dallaii TaxID=48710 RepID=A0ABP1QQL5_9HEXA
MDYMLYEGLNADFRRLPISANTLYKYTPSGNHNQADFLDAIHTSGDDILQSDDDYYVGVPGSLIPLQLNRLLMSVLIKNYGTNSICWLIVCKNHAYKLARLLKKLTHRAKNLTECQIAYDKVMYITMHALQRNSIPYHFREHKPGETITIRSGSYYQGICTGLVVWRQKTTILADYPSLSNDWELIPSCRCHSGERSIFLDAVQAATKEFIQPRTCPCHIREPNILQTEIVTQSTQSSTILQSKEKTPSRIAFHKIFKNYDCEYVHQICSFVQKALRRRDAYLNE